MGVGIIPTLTATRVWADRPVELGLKRTGSPTGRRLNRRLKPFSYRLARARVAHLNRMGSPKSASAGAIAPRPAAQKSGAAGLAPLTASGDRWAGTTRGGEPARATARASGSGGTSPAPTGAGETSIAGFRQNRSPGFPKKKRGAAGPFLGTARSKVGGALLNIALPPPTGRVKSDWFVPAVMGAKNREAAEKPV